MLKMVGLACLLILFRLFGVDVEEKVTTKKPPMPVASRCESGISARCVNTSDGILIAWDDKDEALSYDIYRSPDDPDDDWEYYDTVIAPKDKFIDTDATSGVLQEYRICGCYEDGSMVVSNKAIHIWVPPVESLAFQSVENGVQISWDAIDGASGYRVYRTLDKQLLPVGFLDGDTTMYLDEDATEDGQTYGYAVSAVMSWDHRDFFSDYSVEYMVYGDYAS